MAVDRAAMENTTERLPCERALKTESETGVLNEFTFCLGSPVKKTNSVK